MNVGVFFPTALNTFAVVYLVISSLVHTKCPCAPDPLACTTRSGIRSRLKWAIFSNSKKSSNTTGPRGPTVSEFWLSPTGRPASVVILLRSSDIVYLQHQSSPPAPIHPIYSSHRMDRHSLWNFTSFATSVQSPSRGTSAARLSNPTSRSRHFRSRFESWKLNCEHCSWLHLSAPFA